MLSISAGPLALSIDRLLFLLALGAALLVGWLMGRRHRISVEPVLTQMLLGGVLAARIGFVVQYLDEYLVRPVSMLDIRDGGFMLEAGLIAAALIALFRAWRWTEIRRPLGAALAAGSLTWASTAGALLLLEETRPRLPEMALANLEGGSQSLAGTGGKPLVVNLWATWCPPCRREMPILAEAQQREENVRFIFVNQGEAHADVSHYLASEELRLRNVLMDPRLKLSQQFGAQGMPTTLFFDADGKLVDSHLGEVSMATLKRSLKRLSSQPNE